MTAEAVLCRTTVEWEPGAPSVGTLLGDSQCGPLRVTSLLVASMMQAPYHKF